MSQSQPFRIDLAVDVKAGGSVAGRVFVPDPDKAAALPAPIWTVAAPGATNTWRYWDVHPDFGFDDWSYADFMTRRGVGVVAVDTFGTGDSQYNGHGSDLDMATLALAHHQASKEIRARLRAGDIANSVVDPVLVGVGNSGGAGLTVCTQGAHGTYDMIAPMGLPAAEFGGYEGGADEVRALLDLRADGLFDLIVSEFDANYGVSYVPGGTPIEVIRWGSQFSVPIPPGMPALMVPGALKEYAEKVTVPAFVAFGEIDLSPNPLDEYQCYTATSDLTIWVHKDTAHSHVYSPERAALHDVLFNWMWSRAKYHKFSK